MRIEDNYSKDEEERYQKKLKEVMNLREKVKKNLKKCREGIDENTEKLLEIINKIKSKK